MTTPSSNRSVSRRAVVRGAAGFGMLAPVTLAAPAVARAQEEATPTSLADHPVVGFWELGHPAGHALFHADGTYYEANPYGYGTGIGIWRATGARTAGVLIRFPDFREEAPIDSPVRGTIWWSVAVDDAGHTLSGGFIDETTEGESGSGFVTGTRLTFETLPRPA